MVGVEVTAQNIGRFKYKGRKRKADDGEQNDEKDGDYEPDEDDADEE